MSSIKDNKVLRWIAVPFAAVLGGLVLYTILWVMTYMAGGSPYEREGVVSIVSIILYYLKQGALGYGFVYCGAFCAPSHKLTTAKVLASTASVLALITFLCAIIIGEHWLAWSSAIATAVGAWISKSTVEDDEK